MILSCFVEYKKTLIILGISIAFVIFALQVNDLTKQSEVTTLEGSDKQGVDTSSVKGQVEFIVKDSNGNIKQRIVEHNLIVNRGLDFTVGNVFASSPPATTMKFIALGVGTGQPAAADTTLGSEFLIVSTANTHTATHPHYMRGIATITPNIGIGGDTIGTVQLQKNFNVLNHSSRSANDQVQGELILADTSGTTATIKEAGIFDAASAGNMFAKISIGGGVTVQNGDVLGVTWKIDYD